jgi:hypothetical protein
METVDKAGYLEERDGTKSSSRMIMLLGFLASLAFGAVAVIDPSRATVATNLCWTFLGVPSGLKTIKDFAPSGGDSQ